MYVWVCVSVWVCVRVCVAVCMTVWLNIIFMENANFEEKKLDTDLTDIICNCIFFFWLQVSWYGMNEYQQTV